MTAARGPARLRVSRPAQLPRYGAPVNGALRSTVPWLIIPLVLLAGGACGGSSRPSRSEAAASIRTMTPPTGLAPDAPTYKCPSSIGVCWQSDRDAEETARLAGKTIGATGAPACDRTLSTAITCVIQGHVDGYPTVITVFQRRSSDRVGSDVVVDLRST